MGTVVESVFFSECWYTEHVRGFGTPEYANCRSQYITLWCVCANRNHQQTVSLTIRKQL